MFDVSESHDFTRSNNFDNRDALENSKSFEEENKFADADKSIEDSFQKLKQEHRIPTLLNGGFNPEIVTSEKKGFKDTKSTNTLSSNG